MDLKIYLDQTGTQYYPVVQEEQNKSITDLFEKEIFFVLKKQMGNLELACLVHAAKPSGRNEGYYVWYKGIYDPDIFRRFKKETEIVFEQINLNISSENLVFHKMEQLSEANGRLIGDKDAISFGLTQGKHFDFGSQSVKSVISFCSNLLQSFSTLDVCISRKQKQFVDFNIFLDSSSFDVIPTDDTLALINKYRREVQNFNMKSRRKKLLGDMDKIINDLSLAGLNREDIDYLLFDKVVKKRSNKMEYVFRLLDKGNYFIDWNYVWNHIPKDLINQRTKTQKKQRKSRDSNVNNISSVNYGIRSDHRVRGSTLSDHDNGLQIMDYIQMVVVAAITGIILAITLYYVYSMM